MNKRWLERAKDTALIALGSAMLAAGISCFNAPNGIAAGGVSGAATILNHLTGWPIGLFILLLNVPIFLVGARQLGMRFLWKSLASTLMVSIFTDLFSAAAPKYTGNTLLACLYGGVISGAGIALVFLRGATTGGTDIVAKLLHGKYPYLSMGRIFLVVDFFIVAAACLAYWNIENGLYAMITIFASSRVMDSMLYGADTSKVLLVNSRHYDAISERILHQLHRGVTILDGTGAYTKQQNKVLLCAVRDQEVARLQKIVREVDPKAFLVTLSAGEILGEGFKKI